MATGTISTKGQITLPAALRRKLGVRAHDRVVIEGTNEAIVIRRAADFLELKGAFGMALPREKERREMQRAVAARNTGRRK